MRDATGINRRRMMGGTLLAMASAACGQASRSSGAGGVRAFGAIGDGVADDAPAIQRAIDAAARSGGGVVTLDPGTYLVRYRPSGDGDGGSALTLRSGVTLEGTERARCILKLADAQLGPGSYARIIASQGEIARATLRGFTIDGSRQSAGPGPVPRHIRRGGSAVGMEGALHRRYRREHGRPRRSRPRHHAAGNTR